MKNIIRGQRSHNLHNNNNLHTQQFCNIHLHNDSTKKGNHSTR